MGQLSAFVLINIRFYFTCIRVICCILHSLKNNLIVHEEMQTVLKVLEENNYSCDLGDGIFEPNTTPSIGMRLNQEDHANSSIQKTSEQWKIFVL